MESEDAEALAKEATDGRGVANTSTGARTAITASRTRGTARLISCLNRLGTSRCEEQALRTLPLVLTKLKHFPTTLTKQSKSPPTPTCGGCKTPCRSGGVGGRAGIVFGPGNGKGSTTALFKVSAFWGGGVVVSPVATAKDWHA